MKRHTTLIGIPILSGVSSRKMALRKYDTANSEQFVTPIRGLYSEHVISIEDFKERNI